MGITKEEKIIIIAQLQACLSEFSQDPHLHGVCEKISKTNNLLMSDVVSELEAKSIQELLQDFKTFASDESVLLFDTLLF